MDDALQAGYAFGSFEHPVKDGKQIFLRHDVDYSLEMAVRLAQVNKEMGVAGTFFILLRSQVYNPLSERSLREIHEIHNLGQIIGLHATFPPEFRSRDPYGETVDRMEREFQVLAENVPILRPVFAWHNPNREILNITQMSDSISGIINVYGAKFTRDMLYLADSNLRHSPEDFTRAIQHESFQSLHLLFHPLIWVLGGNSMPEILSRSWRWIIREREYDMRSNRIYADTFPMGMPDSVLDAFVADLGRASTLRLTAEI